MSMIVQGLRDLGPGTGTIPPAAPPTGYLWLYDSNTSQYIVDPNSLYILVPTPFIPWV